MEAKLEYRLSDPGVVGAMGLDESGTVHPDMMIVVRLQIVLREGDRGYLEARASRLDYRPYGV